MTAENPVRDRIVDVKPSLWLELTPHCNLSCKFCYNPWRPENPTSYVRAPSPEDIIARAHRLTTRMNFSYVALSGGEPLLFRGLEKVVTALADQVKWLVLTTNGVYLSRARANRLFSAGLTSVQVPLMAASARIHDEISGRESWFSAVRALAISLQTGFRTSATFVLTKTNAVELPKVVGLLADLGVRRLIVNRLQDGGSSIENSESLKIGEEDRLHAIAEASKIAAKHGVAIINVPSARSSSTKNSSDRAWGRWALSPDGSLKLCNLSEESLGTIDDLSDDFLDRLANDLIEGRIMDYRDSINNCRCLDRGE